MTNYINIIAEFADKAHYLNQNPQTVKFSYESDGKPLNNKDSVKIEKITNFLLQNELYPIFVVVNDGIPVEAEALVNLNLWSNEGLPKYKIRDNYGVIIPGIPNANPGK